MTNEQLVAKFNPANAKNLKAEDLQEMRNLTDDQISILAEAYPNKPAGKAYIRLYDKNVAENKQLYPLSTWQNLRNVRKFSSMKNLTPFDFFDRGAKVEKLTPPSNVGKPSAKKVIDMGAQEAAAELRASMANKATAPEPTEGASAKKGGNKAGKTGVKASKAMAEKTQIEGSQNDSHLMSDGSDEFPEIK